MSELDLIIVRQAPDDQQAMLTASAMQSLPYVDVVSIVCRPAGYSTNLEKWHIYAKCSSDETKVTESDINTAILLVLRDYYSSIP